MITHIEIDGFKSFHKFQVDLRPFQVFIGLNGTGKSNFFDAIILLSHLAGDNNIYDAFRKSRGEVGELFTLDANGERASQMKFAVEMLIAKQVTDSSGEPVDVSSTRLRYELTIERRQENGLERLYIVYESLIPIIGDDDQWIKKYIPNNKHKGENLKKWIVRGRRTPYISTDNQNSRQPTIFRHQDLRQGAKQGTPLGRLERTVLSLISSSEYPTAFAARREMLNWQFLQINPTDVRRPSNVYSPIDLLPDASNLAAVLYRMSQEDKLALNDVSIDMSNLVSGIQKISIKPLLERQELIIQAQMDNQTTLSSQVLSDGTLRLLTFVTMNNDPHYRGVLCMEEPENGVHPGRLKQIVALLASLATDFNVILTDSELEEELETLNQAPRQVLINTHSPALIPYTDPDNLLFVMMQLQDGIRSTRMIPAFSGLIESGDPLAYFTLSQIEHFLDTVPAREILEKLKAAE